MSMQAPGAAGQYHVLSIEGPPKSGKTITAINGTPDKVSIHSTDRGYDGVIQKQYPDDYATRFLVGDYYVSVDLGVDEMSKAANTDEEKARAAKAADQQAARIDRETWQPFKKDYTAMLQRPDVRSHVLDFSNELYDYLRLANFGKLERNPRLAYVLVNAEFTSLIRDAHKYKKNLVLVNQVTKKWRKVADPLTGIEKEQETDEWKRKGPDSNNFLVHGYVRTSKLEPVRDRTGAVQQEGRWFVEILSARLNPAVNGSVLESPDWPTMMSFLAPDVPMEAWL